MECNLRTGQFMEFSPKSGRFIESKRLIHGVQITNWPIYGVTPKKWLIHVEQVANLWGAIYELANSWSAAQKVVDS